MKTNIIRIIIFFSLVYSSACTKENLDPLNDSSPSKGDDQEMYDNKMLVQPFFAGDGLYDVLGNGYDVTEEYANANSARQPIINVEKLILERSGDFHQNHTVIQDAEYVAGENVEEYSKKITGNFNLDLPLALFSADIKAGFSETNAFSNKYAYGRYIKYIQQKRMMIYTPVNIITQKYLTPTFVNDIEKLTPAQIVRKYGTHVLVDVFLGARLDINYKTETNTKDYISSVNAGLKFSISEVFGFSADINTDVSRKNKNFNQWLYYKTIGGDGSKGLEGTINMDGTSTPTLNIQNWQNSCTKENAGLIKIGKDGLIPIQNFVTSPTKKAALNNYITQYFQNNRVQIVDNSNIRFGRYKIINSNSKQVMAIPQSSTKSGEDVIQHPWTSFTDQQWDIEKLIDGTYKITNANSGLVLAVSEASRKNGHKLIQYRWTGGAEQRWKAIQNSNGSFRFENSNSGQVIAVSQGSKKSGAKIIQYPWQSKSEQSWSIELIN